MEFRELIKKPAIDQVGEKCLTGALIASVASLTLFCATSDAAHAESSYLLDRIISDSRIKTGNQIQIAQADTVLQPRLAQLEQAVRDLTVQVETLEFTLLQMQNKMDALESRPPSYPAVKIANTDDPEQPPVTVESTPEQEKTAVDMEVTQIFGAVRFDGYGGQLDRAQSFILPETSDPKEFYKIGYQYIMAGDYPAAERIFRAFRERFPEDEQVADASFWLGEALYAQGQYREAAQIYIDVQRQHQNSAHGPENLLKLGLSMARLQETDVACKTLAEVPKRHKQAEPAVLKRVRDEQSRLGCP